MRFINKSVLAAIPLALVLAGCNTTHKAAAPAANAQEQSAATQAAPVQAANVNVFLASKDPVKGYRPIKLNDQKVVYISPRAIFDRSNLTAIDIVNDQQKRTYVKLTLNAQGAAALKAVPAKSGFATVVGGRLQSLNGVRMGNDFLFNVRDDQAAVAIVRAIVPQQQQATR